MRLRLLAALSLVVAAACAPSMSPRMQSTTDALLAATRGNHHVAASKSKKPMPWAPGQWAAFRNVDVKNNRPSFMKLSVVGQDAAGIWVEIESQDYFHHTIVKTLYSHMPSTAEEAADAVQKTITKTDDGAPQTLDFTSNEPGVAMMKGMMKGMIQGVYVPSLESGTTETLTVPAGTFEGCTKTTASVSFGPVKMESTGWFHPAVPINGAVKSVATDGSYTMELLDFGTTGAKSAL